MLFETIDTTLHHFTAIVVGKVDFIHHILFTMFSSRVVFSCFKFVGETDPIPFVYLDCTLYEAT